MRITHSIQFVVRTLVLVCLLSGSTAAYGQPVREEAPSWSDEAVESLIFAVSEAWTHGLDPDDYSQASQLISLPAGRERDLRATGLFMIYGGHLAFGKVDPRTIEDNWTAPVEDQDLAIWLRSATRSGDVYETLEALAPQNPDYQSLRQELIYRTTLSENPIEVPDGEPLSRGDSGPRVDALRARLNQMGFLENLDAPGAPFDALLETAVLRFQSRHNLDADGVVSTNTLLELNASVSWRMAQLKANLERWRWLSHDLGARHIRVNLADYRLEAWEDGRVERVHTTQVGRGYSRTPVFSDEMSFLEINPIWYAPGRLGWRWVRMFQTNPSRALAEGFRLVDHNTGQVIHHSQANWDNGRYRVIQYPHPNNAMGQVKFMFPNRHNVYIHDTPHRDNFLSSQRAASAGCVRLQDPIDLAWWILQDESGWTRARLESIVESDDITRVPLDTQIPVHILYFTAVADQFGEIRFVHDVYERDQTLINALLGELSDELFERSESPDREATTQDTIASSISDSLDDVVILPEEEDANAQAIPLAQNDDQDR